MFCPKGLWPKYLVDKLSDSMKKNTNFISSNREILWVLNKA